MQMSGDGVLVMSHNPVLNPEITVDADGNRIEKNTWFINEMTVDEIQSFNVGAMDESTEYYALHGQT
jgi:glycerophosphoryl diester phosphodiesterase